MLLHALSAVMASAVLGHPPAVEWSFLSAASQWRQPSSLPPGVIAESVTPIGRRRVLIHTQDNRNFVADGASAVEVCVPGTHIPGQPDGVRWGALMPVGNAIILRDRPPLFTLTASVPNFPTNEVRAFLGDPASPGPFWMSDRYAAAIVCTPNGLTFDVADGGSMRIGPFDGDRSVVLPSGFTPPGRGAPIVGWDWSRNMNSDGQFAGIAILGDNFWSAAVVGPGGFRELLAPGATIESDRGPFTVIARPASVLQPLGDGSVVISGPTQFPEGSRAAAYVIGRDGRASVIAAEGDHAPACPDGYTLSSITPLAATRSGLVLWAAGLQLDGLRAGQAFYVRDGARSRLILRSGALVHGGPALELSLSSLGAQLNEDGSVLLVGLQPNAAYLYTPRSGTVEVMRSPAGLRRIQGTWLTLQLLSPRVSGGYTMLTSGGDDTANDYFSNDGVATMVGFGTANNAMMPFGVALRISDPGCRPDYTLDGDLSFADFGAFVECFEGGACPAGKDGDFNNDGFVDFFDYDDFVAGFEAGC